MRLALGASACLDEFKGFLKESMISLDRIGRDRRTKAFEHPGIDAFLKRCARHSFSFLVDLRRGRADAAYIIGCG